MSLKRRFINIARTELRDAARKVKSSADELLGDFSQTPREEPLDLGDDPYDFNARPTSEPHTPIHDEIPDRVRRYYANLELPVGASRAEVKAAYRRLIRDYHPDKHAQDPKRAQLANELSQRLRTAYEGLMAYLPEDT